MIVNCPWGYYEDILREPTCVIKRIVVMPGQRLSLQKHALRSEFWFISEGEGKMQLGTIESVIKVGSTVNILPKEIHRVTNTGNKHLVIYEMQYGKCSEDDIVRLEDDYGR
jgi:mannose-6-phosphate isomerase-like protein (cupin superfamily)